MLAALALGALVMVLDRALHYPLQQIVAGKASYPSAKYNRGLDYMALLIWPLLACGAMAQRGRVVILAAILMACLAAAGASTSSRMALLAGAAFYGAARLLPRQTPRLTASFLVVMALTLPVWLRRAARHRAELAGHIKESGIHRLEIWDYMTARVAERPLLGWGLGAAHAVPIHPDELRSFHFVTPQGVYPHQQWLELWLELGVLGAVLALAFTLLVLWRTARLPPRIRPFGYATIGAALAVSFSNFEITTDSWWAALAATAFLLRAAARLEAA
jgi:exopolysaccharide production protein ExoQ